MKGRIKIKTEAFLGYLKIGNLSQEQFAKEESIDPGNFSRMMNGELEPSKPVMKKLMMRTGYSFDALFELDKNATSEDNDKTNNN